MIISICVGSSCHLKGSREIVNKLESLILEHQLKEKVELNGSFCMGHCVKGVCVTVDGTIFSVRPETTQEFFKNEGLRRLT